VRNPKVVSILGTRGVPAGHGGFETLAERLSRYLIERNWNVTVYCQSTEQLPPGEKAISTLDYWEGIRRITFTTSVTGPLSTVAFDWAATRHAAQESGLKLILGYNTAVFASLLRFNGHKVVIHMDGVEWIRPKWSWPTKIWFMGNFHCANLVGNSIVADHPELMKKYSNLFNRRKMTLITYGGDPVANPPTDAIAALGLEPDRYFTVIARLEPDNSILEIVRAFSDRLRGYKLVVLGNLDGNSKYHRAVRKAASSEVIFPGAIYDKSRVQALRYYSRAYIHGHMAGGTNPSLVEALWAGNAVIAHRNRFNLWTAGSDQRFFGSVSECSNAIDEVIENEDAVQLSRRAAKAWAERNFSWSVQLAAYESLLEEMLYDRRPWPVGVQQPSVEK
jgi:glycosyltransferase involved in cell wall biosynthesis